MPYLDPTILGYVAALVVGGLIVSVLVHLFVGRRLPKQRKFKCAKCSAWTEHTARTIEAWRVGRTKFYCNACHGQWVRTHPAPQYAPDMPTPSRPTRSSPSGCLGVTVFMVLLPTVAILSWWLYA